ncbi:hypothetical protein F7725_025759 [Dissostichus mawsoni]|uniref:Uncharacterized protein n=1 Tax=Dissostichus mawsoni TaxID=36200 RepID=A0A7J5X552_DISMA|nr:hypothetical protein F7725_025759 [Dissostichus mawsoni]
MKKTQAHDEEMMKTQTHDEEMMKTQTHDEEISQQESLERAQLNDHRFELQRESFSLRVEEGKGGLKMHLRGVQEREEQEEEECFVLEPTFAENSETEGREDKCGGRSEDNEKLQRIKETSDEGDGKGIDSI